MNTTQILTHLIRAGRDALHLEKTLNSLGYRETPYFNLYGEITDAIYGILGEETDTVEDSLAHAALNDCLTPDEICAERLAATIPCPVPDLPEPVTEVIAEAAKARNMKPENMIRLILSEWAMKELYANSMMK